MKEVSIKQVEGGYIVVTANAETREQKVQVTPNFGRAVKVAKALFGGEILEPEKQVEEVA